MFNYLEIYNMEIFLLPLALGLLTIAFMINGGQ